MVHERMVIVNEATPPLETYIGMTPDIIGITSGSVVERNGNNVHRVLSTTGSTDLDARKMFSWGKVRSIGALELAKRFPHAVMLPLTRSTNNNFPESDAAVMGSELRRRGVKNTMTEIHEPLDTFTEMLALAGFALDAGRHDVLVLTTHFQKPRVAAMMDSIQNHHRTQDAAQITQMFPYLSWKFPKRQADVSYFEDLFHTLKKKRDQIQMLRTKFVAAEDVLPYRDERYEPILFTVMNSLPYLRKVESDLEGTRQWLAGEYGYIPGGAQTFTA